MENPLNFLKKKYANLHTSPEVMKSAERTEYRKGEKVSEKPEDRIENYLNRFKEILDRQDPEKRAMGIEAMKRVLHKQLIISPENIPLDYFLDQEQRIAEQQGHGRPEPTPDWEEKKIKEIQDGQRRSLDAWIDYLSSPDALYPDWAKYWAFRSMTEMGGYNKKEARYGRRTKTTSQPFPTLNIACLAKTIDVIQKQVALSMIPKDEINMLDRQKKEKELMYSLNHDGAYRELVSTENFSKLYTHALEQFSGMSWKHLENIAGKWKTYPENSAPNELYESLQGYPLEWCTATNIETARTQLQGGDFHVYYSQDEQGISVIPRVAIRMTGDSISEIRGIEKDQNVDQFIQPVIDEKLSEFGAEGEKYLKRSADMKHLTAITEKNRAGLALSSNDLRFLYEMDGSIEGFGYQKDPRIAEILSTRNAMDDAPVIFDCAPDQIANTVDQVNENTVAYIGPWNIDIYEKMPATVQYLYESFPETKIFKQSLELSTKTPEQYTKELTAKGNQIGTYAQQILNKVEALKSPEQIKLVSFSVEQLGFPNGATLQEIYDKARSMGLELCPPQVGPELRLSYTDQPNSEYLVIAMEAITDADGDPRLFYVYRNDSGPWLDSDDGRMDSRWGASDRFVFRSSKS